MCDLQKIYGHYLGHQFKRDQHMAISKTFTGLSDVSDVIYGKKRKSFKHEFVCDDTSNVIVRHHEGSREVKKNDSDSFSTYHVSDLCQKISKSMFLEAVEEAKSSPYADIQKSAENLEKLAQPGDDHHNDYLQCFVGNQAFLGSTHSYVIQRGPTAFHKIQKDALGQSTGLVVLSRVKEGDDFGSERGC